MAERWNCTIVGNPFDGICTFINGRIGASVVGIAAERLLWALVVFIALVVIGRALRLFTRRALHLSKADIQLAVLVNNAFLIVTTSIASLFALHAAGVDLNVLLTLGGVATLAIGLAFQDLLRNVLAGMFLLIERPFRIGDDITVGEQSGIVETIALRTTALRRVDGRLAILPNTAAFTGTIINASTFTARRFTVTARVPAGVDLDAALRTVRLQLDSTRQIARRPAAVVQLQTVDDTLVLLCHYWLEWRLHDPVAVEADLTRRIYMALTRLSRPA